MRNMICDQREKEMETPRNDSVISGFVFLWCHGVQSSAVRAKKWLNWKFIIVHLAFPDHIIGSRRRVKEGSASWLKGKRPRYDIVRFSCQASNRLRWNIWFPLSLWNTFWSSWSQEEEKTLSSEKKLSLCFSILWTSHTAHYVGVEMVGWTGGA